jgi:hypothetical protein
VAGAEKVEVEITLRSQDYDVFHVQRATQPPPTPTIAAGYLHEADDLLANRNFKFCFSACRYFISGSPRTVDASTP